MLFISRMHETRNESRMPTQTVIKWRMRCSGYVHRRFCERQRIDDIKLKKSISELDRENSLRSYDDVGAEFKGYGAENGDGLRLWRWADYLLSFFEWQSHVWSQYILLIFYAYAWNRRDQSEFVEKNINSSSVVPRISENNKLFPFCRMPSWEWNATTRPDPVQRMRLPHHVQETHKEMQVFGLNLLNALILFR